MSDCGITNIGCTVAISTTTEDTDLDLSGFEALTYTQLPNIGTVGDTGITQNAVSYPTWDRQVLCKGKGQADAGDPTIEAQDVPSAGLDLFLAAAAFDNANAYAFRFEWPDGSVEYNRGLVMGPQRPKGGNEDFKRVVFTLGLLQPPEVAEGPSS